ncbi:NYN domain-containing protein [Terrabacter carboxydivorans]|uniref:NYN domain-containing protein n=1 Tax=Terrabacter carboxydivorans TaxID=619730 RepID=A0ABN3KWV0_9MICO
MTNQPRVAVLLDCDNVSWQRASAVIAEAATHGVLGVKRGYGDWGSPHLSRWRQQLVPLAIQPVQQIAYVAGKGATDMALVIDAMDLLYSGQVDTFCLVASDSDYTRLAMRLREAGKRVIGIGAKHTPAAFSSACDRFTFVEVLGAAPVLAEPDELMTGSIGGLEEPEPSGDSAAQPATTPTAGQAPDLDEMLNSALAACQGDDGWALLSNVGFQLVSNHPTFDSRNYGYARLGQLVRDQPNLEIREVPGANGNSVLHLRVREVQ